MEHCIRQMFQEFRELEHAQDEAQERLRETPEVEGAPLELPETEDNCLSVVNMNNAKCNSVASASNAYATFSAGAAKTFPGRRSLEQFWDIIF